MLNPHDGRNLDGRGAADALVDAILSFGVDGVGPFKSAVQLAEEHRARHLDPEQAVDKLIATHTRLVAGRGSRPASAGRSHCPPAFRRI